MPSTHKLLIVDDEPLARSNLTYYVLRSGFQFQWVQEADSAEQALEIIQRDSPDILLTDIIMGEKTGLDLIEEAKQISPTILSVIISGYDEFEFARQALQHGTHRYLLKPVGQDQINEVLANATAEVLRRKRFKRLLAENEKLEEKLWQKDIDIEIESLLHGVKDTDFHLLTTLFPGGMGYFQIFIALLGEPDASFHQREHHLSDSYELLRYGMNNIISELAGSTMVPFKSYGNYRQVTILAASDAPNLAAARKEIADRMKRIHTAVTETLQLPVYLGGSEVTEALTGTQSLQAAQALDQRLCLGVEERGALYCYEEVAQRESCYSQDQLDRDMDVLENYLNCGMLQEALDMVGKIMTARRGEPFLLLRTAYIEILCILTRSCYKKGFHIFSFLGSEAISGAILDTFQSLEELTAQLEHTITTALVHWSDQNQNTDTILQQIKLYIEHNFTDSELGTSVLSEQFCISPGYLSTLFRKTFDITISKYIIRQRVQYAGELLLSTELTLQEISENCGFNNLSYFMRVFKRYSDQTPAEYRRQNLPTGKRG